MCDSESSSSDQSDKSERGGPKPQESEQGTDTTKEDESSEKEEESDECFSSAEEETLAKDEGPKRKEVWRISSFKRAFPVKQYAAGYPDAAKKVYMENRRPLWLPQGAIDADYFQQASYFSEVLAQDQLKRKAVFEKLYKPHLGEYAYSSSDLITRTYISKYLRGAQSVRFSPDGEHLVIGCGNGAIQIRNMKTRMTSVHCIRGYARRITAIRFFPYENSDKKIFFASSMTGRVFMGRMEKDGQWRCYCFLKELNNEINAMDLTRSGARMGTAGRDSIIRIYDPNEEKLVHMYLRPGMAQDDLRVPSEGIPEEGHYRRVCAFKFNRNDENVFVTGGWDDIIKVWDVRMPMPVQSLAGPHLTSNSIDVWGKVVLIGQWTCSDSIQLWDMRACEYLAAVQPLNRPIWYAGEFINEVQFVHSWEGPPITIPGAIGDLILAVGSGTKALEVISIKENMVLHRTQESNAVVGVDHFRSLIAYGCVNQLYGIVSFLPFVGNLSKEMKFKDKKTEEEMIKQFSSSGNPMGWHEVAIDLDFMQAFASKSEQIDDETIEMEFSNPSPEEEQEKAEALKQDVIYSYKIIKPNQNQNQNPSHEKD